MNAIIHVGDDAHIVPNVLVLDFTMLRFEASYTKFGNRKTRMNTEHSKLLRGIRVGFGEGVRLPEDFLVRFWSLKNER
ncbi:MAG: hypothetical protein RSB38_03835, partial [Oscillospiraceae bacterium]